MKKLTRFPAALLLLAAVFALAVGCTGCTAKARKVYHEKRAEKFYAASQFDRAEIEYLNVLHNDPMDAQAIGRLGLILLSGRPGGDRLSVSPQGQRTGDQ